MNYRFIKLLAGLLLLAGLQGCATGEEIEWGMDEPQNSLIYGYIDMDDAPTDMEWASLKQVQPPSETPYWNFLVEDGVFFQPYPREGAYQLAAFGGSSFLGGPHQYSFPEYGNNSGIMIDKPGFYFVGAFKYVEVDTGWLEADKFALEPTDSMSEVEILRLVLQHDDIQDSPNWQRRIKARIQELSK